MTGQFLGEIAAITTAICWTFTALSFEAAGKRVGSLAVNMLRLIIGFTFISLFTCFWRGHLLPLDASPSAWFWLLLSGIVGFVIGDLFLFKALVIIGSRIAMLVMSLVPPMTAVIGWLIMDEVITGLGIIGMLVTVLGIVIVVNKKKSNTKTTNRDSFVRGIVYALLGAVGQAIGLVLSKFGMGDYDPFAATQIRIIAGLAGFALLFTLKSRWHAIPPAIKNHSAMGFITLGAFFGPFLGVAMSLLAVQHTETGIAATIMALVPVLIIFPSVLVFKEKIVWRDIVGAVIAVSGVALLFLR